MRHRLNEKEKDLEKRDIKLEPENESEDSQRESRSDRKEKYRIINRVTQK